MAKSSKLSWPSMALSGLLGLVFLGFGGMKLFDLHGFVSNVANFQFAPFDRAPWDMLLAYFLVPLEILVGAALLMRVWMRGALALSIGMTVAFMVGIGSVWSRGLNIDCGCSGGVVPMGGYPTHMMVLSVMLGAAVYAFIDVLFPSVDEA